MLFKNLAKEDKKMQGKIRLSLALEYNPHCIMFLKKIFYIIEN